MPLTPQITLTITLDDLQGVDIGSTANPAFVEIALANYGPTLPRINGTALLARVGPGSQKIPYLGTPITVTLFGNDVITPAGTYYAITILDDKLNILQSGAYVFTGTISADLSTLAQFFPSPTSSVSGGEVTLQPSATPTFDCGLVNGPVEFYLLLTENVTSSTLLPNIAGQIVIFRLQQDATGGRTFVWPGNVQSPPAVNSAANSVTTAAFFLASNGTGYLLEDANGAYPASGQIGDILRWNGTAWQSVNYAQPAEVVVPVFGGNPVAYGPLTNGTVTGYFGSSTSNLPTVTAGVTNTYTYSAGASSSTVIGLAVGHNGNNSLMAILGFDRWSMKMSIPAKTGLRFWLGMGCWGGSGSTGGNQTSLNASNSTMASDTPSKSFIGFRYSDGTDTHWMAVAISNSGGGQTTVDTLVSPDTANFHTFEMTVNDTFTLVTYFIDGLQVAQISTNLPNQYGTLNYLGEPFFSGDNKNTATTVTLTFGGLGISLKP